jgi:hypothetical protein
MSFVKAIWPASPHAERVGGLAAEVQSANDALSESDVGCAATALWHFQRPQAR